MLKYWKYFLLTIMFWGVFFLYEPGQDHIGAISPTGDASWYMDFYCCESQDRDILFHDIGHSIENARMADIVIIGNSRPLFAFDRTLLKDFCAKYGIRVFNLSSGGDSSGEFLLRVIQKHGIRPFIFVVNAEGKGGKDDFFHPHLNKGGPGEAKYVVRYDRKHAMSNVVTKNFYWRLESRLRRIFPPNIVSMVFARDINVSEPLKNYRSAETGDLLNDTWPGYHNPVNPPLTNSREPDCHASKETLDEAARYIRVLGNSHVVLTVVPWSQSCRKRVREIAEHCGTPYIDVEWWGLSTFDRAEHLDSRSAKIFTAEFLRSLEQTPFFLDLVSKKHTKE